MKTEYITPDTKVVKIKMETALLVLSNGAAAPEGYNVDDEEFVW